MFQDSASLANRPKFERRDLIKQVALYAVAGVIQIILAITAGSLTVNLNALPHFSDFQQSLQDWRAPPIQDIKLYTDTSQCPESHPENIISFEIGFESGCVSKNSYTLTQDKNKCKSGERFTPSVPKQRVTRWVSPLYAQEGQALLLCAKRSTRTFQEMFFTDESQQCAGQRVCAGGTCVPGDEPCPITTLNAQSAGSNPDKQIVLSDDWVLAVYRSESRNATPLSGFRVTEGVTGVCEDPGVENLSPGRFQHPLVRPPHTRCATESATSSLYSSVHLTSDEKSLFDANGVQFDVPLYTISAAYKYDLYQRPFTPVSDACRSNAQLRAAVSGDEKSFAQQQFVSASLFAKFWVQASLAAVLLCVGCTMVHKTTGNLFDRCVLRGAVMSEEQVHAYRSKPAGCYLVMVAIVRVLCCFVHAMLAFMALVETNSFRAQIQSLDSEKCVQGDAGAFISALFHRTGVVLALSIVNVAFEVVVVAIEIWLWRVAVQAYSQRVRLFRAQRTAERERDDSVQHANANRRLWRDWQVRNGQQAEQAAPPQARQEVRQRDLEMQKDVFIHLKDVPIYQVDEDNFDKAAAGREGAHCELVECMICLNNDPPPFYTLCCNQPMHVECRKNMQSCPHCRKKGLPKLENVIRKAERAFKIVPDEQPQ